MPLHLLCLQSILRRYSSFLSVAHTSQVNRHLLFWSSLSCTPYLDVVMTVAQQLDGDEAPAVGAELRGDDDRVGLGSAASCARRRSRRIGTGHVTQTTQRTILSFRSRARTQPAHSYGNFSIVSNAIYDTTKKRKRDKRTDTRNRILCSLAIKCDIWWQ